LQLAERLEAEHADGETTSVKRRGDERCERDRVRSFIRGSGNFADESSSDMCVFGFGSRG